MELEMYCKNIKGDQATMYIQVEEVSVNDSEDE